MLVWIQMKFKNLYLNATQPCPSGAQSRTKVVHKTLKPQWNEELHVLVQEPSTQLLRVEMFDHDIFNVKVRKGDR